MVLLTKGADELRLIVVKQTLLDKEQRRCKGSYSQKGAARFFDLYVVEWSRRLSVAWLKNHLQLFLQRIATVQQPLSFSVFSSGILVNSFHRL